MPRPQRRESCQKLRASARRPSSRDNAAGRTAEPVPPEPTVSAETAEEAPKDEKEGEEQDKVEETEETVSAEQLEANKEEVGFQST